MLDVNLTINVTVPHINNNTKEELIMRKVVLLSSNAMLDVKYNPFRVGFLVLGNLTDEPLAIGKPDP